jgi:hypothetical protein
MLRITKISLIGLCFIFFPIGIFVAGYFTGRVKRDNSFTIKSKKESILTDSNILMDEEESDKVYV